MKSVGKKVCFFLTFWFWLNIIVLGKFYSFLKQKHEKNEFIC